MRFLRGYGRILAIGCRQFTSQITRFMGPKWGPSGADMTQVGPMLAPWTLLSGNFWFEVLAFNLEVTIHHSFSKAYRMPESSITKHYFNDWCAESIWGNEKWIFMFFTFSHYDVASWWSNGQKVFNRIPRASNGLPIVTILEDINDAITASYTGF